MEPTFPIEFVVYGTPRSLQGSARSLESWKADIRKASHPVLPEGHWLTNSRLAVAIFCFPAEPMQGDLDNILKPILDALTQHIYFDDHQIDRILVQRFEPDHYFRLDHPSERLASALVSEKPNVYIRISDDPFEDIS